jgi:hypothetical protein
MLPDVVVPVRAAAHLFLGRIRIAPQVVRETLRADSQNLRNLRDRSQRLPAPKWIPIKSHVATRIPELLTSF